MPTAGARSSPVPLRVGVVSSAGTAAWHDFHDELVRSGFGFQVVLADTRVQGPEAGRRVDPGRSRRCRSTPCSAASTRSSSSAAAGRATSWRRSTPRRSPAPSPTAPVPVLTGLGHEIDRSVADEVAHTSLKTPTACAAHLVALRRHVPDRRRAAARRRSSPRRGRGSTAPTGRVAERAHRIARRTHAAVERADERLGTRVHRLRAAATRPVLDAERRLQALAERIPARLPAAARRRGAAPDGDRGAGALARPGHHARPRVEHHPHGSTVASCARPTTSPPATS